MAQIAVVEYLRIYSDGGTKAFWQSFWEGQTIHGASFLPFASGGIIATSTGDMADVTLTLPNLPEVVELYHASVALSWLWELDLRTYSTDAGQHYPISPVWGDPETWTDPLITWSGMAARGSFVGEVVSASADPGQLTVRLGNRISQLSAPPLRFTSVLVGTPARL
jgi:hypothetical protein